ncbi:MAG: hypothetical protein WDM77_21900 [Steroidobacteraceae bacterium]
MQLIDRIRAEQIRALYRNAPPGLIATFLAAVLVTGILHKVGSLPTGVGVAFVAAMGLHVVPRLYLSQRFRTAPRPRTGADGRATSPAAPSPEA